MYSLQNMSLSLIDYCETCCKTSCKRKYIVDQFFGLKDHDFNLLEININDL